MSMNNAERRARQNKLLETYKSLSDDELSNLEQGIFNKYGLPRSKDPEQIVKNYRKLQLRFHPDKHPSGRVTEAYLTISYLYEWRQHRGFNMRGGKTRYRKRVHRKRSGATRKQRR